MDLRLASNRAVVIGSSGGIGGALSDALERAGHDVVRLSRSGKPPIDIIDEASVAAAAAHVGAPIGLVIVATGILQDRLVNPEKSYRELGPDALLHYFAVISVGPAIVAKHFLPLLPRSGRSLFAALSARVGSIADNRLGGWYGYRASKAALNQFIRTLAIELARSRPDAVCVGLHPGTVDTGLSAPFQRNVPAEQLLSKERSAALLLGVLANLKPADSGRCFGWEGAEIAP